MPSSKPSDAVPGEHLRLLVESYQRLTGKALIDNAAGDVAALRAALWNAPFAIVAHGTEADPVFFYGNAYALRCFEMTFEDFARLPSRFSAEPVNQDAREKSLRKVAERGYIDGYSGMRIASSGRRFMIENCTIWNLTDKNGDLHGQAAVFTAQD
jgi:hypothetical protein